MNVRDPDAAAAATAAAIGDPSRARMLFSLCDGRARTSTELAAIAEVSPSTASAHLQRLESQRLLKVIAQGRHRYYSLEGPRVAALLESLSVIAGYPRRDFVPATPVLLRAARTCYDHIAGSLGVALNQRFLALGWLAPVGSRSSSYQLSSSGSKAFSALGIDLASARAQRRRFAFACLDWSERRPHLAGALGAALLGVALKRKWVTPELDSRSLDVTRYGRREMQSRFGVELP